MSSSDIPTASSPSTSPSVPSQTADNSASSASDDAGSNDSAGASSSTTPAPSSTSTSLVFSYTTVTDILGDLNATNEVIDDNDSRVVYQGAWIEWLDSSVYGGTLHTTNQVGSSLFVNFHGTGITVLGYVPLGATVLNVLYTIDGDASTAQSRPVSGSGENIIDQAFFSVSNLPLQQHNLTMNFTSGISSRLFMYDCFVVDKSTGGSQTTSLSPTTSATDHPGSKHSMSGGKIAGIVVGSVIGTILLTLFCCLCCCRRRRRGPPVQDTEPRPLSLPKPRRSPFFNEKNHLDLAGHEDFLFPQTTSPGPVNESTILFECFGIEIRRTARR